MKYLKQITSRPSILIIDDIPTNLDVLVASLQEENMELTVALSGKDGLRLAQELQPDLILLDIMMPVMDGYETAKRLKAHSETTDIPIIFLSAKDDEYDVEQGLLLGAVDYISKPFSMPILKARLRNHLDLQQKTKLLKELAYTDGLTQIANRRHFDCRLEQEWTRAQRNGSPLSLLMIDIDHFKQFNDCFGHSEGDLCLKQVANALSSVLNRTSDILARYGGEEFVVLLPETDLKGALIVAEKLRLSVEALRIRNGHSSIREWVSISLGLSCTVSINDLSKTGLIKLADQALYESKKQGRNQLSVYHLGQFWQANAFKRVQNL